MFNEPENLHVLLIKICLTPSMNIEILTSYEIFKVSFFKKIFPAVTNAHGFIS